MSTFHVPSLVRSGSRPGPVLAPSIEALAAWGGAMTREEDIWRALMAADGLILALTLAGYDADQLAIAIPAGGAAPAGPDLVLVSLETLIVARGATRPWAPTGKARTACIALWLAPFALTTAAGERVTARALGLGALAGLGVDGLTMTITPSVAGWLYVPVPIDRGAWPKQLTAMCDKLTAALRRDLVAALASAWPPRPDKPPGAGMLGVYAPAVWRMSPRHGDGDTMPLELNEFMAAIDGAQHRLTAQQFLDGELLTGVPARDLIAGECAADDTIAALWGACNDLSVAHGTPDGEAEPPEDPTDALSLPMLADRTLTQIVLGYHNQDVMDLTRPLAAVVKGAWNVVQGPSSCVRATPLLGADLVPTGAILEPHVYVDILEERRVKRSRHVRVRALTWPGRVPGQVLGWIAADALHAIGPRPPRPSSPDAQMAALVAATVGWRYKTGRCYASIKHLITKAGGYGDILDPYQDERFVDFGVSAKHFSDAVDTWGTAAFGLEELSVDPHEAPPGSLLVLLGTKIKNSNGVVTSKGNGISAQHGDISVIKSSAGTTVTVHNFANAIFTEATWFGFVRSIYQPIARP